MYIVTLTFITRSYAVYQLKNSLLCHLKDDHIDLWVFVHCECHYGDVSV